MKKVIVLIWKWQDRRKDKMYDVVDKPAYKLLTLHESIEKNTIKKQIKEKLGDISAYQTLFLVHTHTSFWTNGEIIPNFEKKLTCYFQNKEGEVYCKNANDHKGIIDENGDFYDDTEGVASYIERGANIVIKQESFNHVWNHYHHHTKKKSMRH